MAIIVKKLGRPKGSKTKPRLDQPKLAAKQKRVPKKSTVSGLFKQIVALSDDQRRRLFDAVELASA